MDFEKMCTVRGVMFDDLDDWMVAFLKWTVHPKFLLKDLTQLPAAMQQRKQYAKEAKVTVKLWNPKTFRTIVNGLAHLHRQGKPEVGIVPGSEKQFPNYNLTFNECLTRCKEGEATTEQVEVLQDEEVEFLYDVTNWENPHEAQRMNLLILAYQIGQRPENIVTLKVGNAHHKADEHGLSHRLL